MKDTLDKIQEECENLANLHREDFGDGASIHMLAKAVEALVIEVREIKSLALRGLLK